MLSRSISLRCRREVGSYIQLPYYWTTTEHEKILSERDFLIEEALGEFIFFIPMHTILANFFKQVNLHIKEIICDERI